MRGVPLIKKREIFNIERYTGEMVMCTWARKWSHAVPSQGMPGDPLNSKREKKSLELCRA